MRKLLSTILLLIAFPMFTGSHFEIEGLMGFGSMPLATALGLGALTAIFTAGHIASPKPGKIGFFRGLAFVFFLLQSIGFVTRAIVLLYMNFKGASGTSSSDFALMILGGSALAFLVVSSTIWHLFAKEYPTGESEGTKLGI